MRSLASSQRGALQATGPPPPVGAVQFVACAVGKITVWEAMRSIWPFYGAGLIVLGLVTYIPALSLWLPGVFR